jgi:uncharacterized protein (DUF2062 family)
MRAFFRRKLLDPLARQLTQGVSTERLALALALGLVLGTFPVLGATTALCAVAGVALRLNQPAIQVANYVAYPLQLALFIPFFRAGAWLFGAPPVTFTLSDAKAALARDALGTIAAYAGANLRAVAVWAVVAPLIAVALRLALRPLLARLRPSPAGA